MDYPQDTPIHKWSLDQQVSFIVACRHTYAPLYTSYEPVLRDTLQRVTDPINGKCATFIDSAMLFDILPIDLAITTALKMHHAYLRTTVNLGVTHAVILDRMLCPQLVGPEQVDEHMYVVTQTALLHLVPIS
jgi:hypothetical protein